MRTVEENFVFNGAASALEVGLGELGRILRGVLEVLFPTQTARPHPLHDFGAIVLERIFGNYHGVIENGETKVVQQERRCFFTSLLNGVRNVGCKVN